MYKLIPLAVLFAAGCFAQTEGAPEPTPEPCPAVECRWTPEGTCTDESAYSSTKRFDTQDDGASACWYYDTVCIPKGTRPECVPAACRREFVTCQPTAPLGQP